MTSLSVRRRWRAPAFSLAELLVVVGVIALLISLIAPPIQVARRQAQAVHCAAQLQQLGQALQAAHLDYGFYPFWDDGAAPIRHTWIDVLIQRRFISGSGVSSSPTMNDSYVTTSPLASKSYARIGYCPSDSLPDVLNSVRHPNLIYPLDRSKAGIDYSYGIGAPLSAGGWAGSGGSDRPDQPRRFLEHDSRASGRVLAADAYDSFVFNLSGNAATSMIWNDATQFDNTIAWRRHANTSGIQFSTNLLYQDGHVAAEIYDTRSNEPVNTTRSFVWQMGEPVAVQESDQINGQYYPNRLSPALPSDLNPVWYTNAHAWTLIGHK